MFLRNEKVPTWRTSVGLFLLFVLQSQAQAYAPNRPEYSTTNLNVQASISAHDDLYEISNGPTIALIPGEVGYEGKKWQNYAKPVELDPGDRITLMEGTTQADDGEFIYRVGLENDGQEPYVILVPGRLLPLNRLTAISEQQQEAEHNGDQTAVDDDETPIDALLSGKFTAQENEYVQSEEARLYGRSTLKKRKHGRKRMTYCLKKVRVRMAHMGICRSDSFGGEAGRAIAQILNQCGTRVHRVPLRPGLKIGTVCTIQGGYHTCGKGRHRHACGDVVIKIGKNAWTNGYRVRSSPLNGAYSNVSCVEPTSRHRRKSL